MTTQCTNDECRVAKRIANNLSVPEKLSFPLFQIFSPCSLVVENGVRKVGVNFINVLRAALVRADPKSVKKTDNLTENVQSVTQSTSVT